MSRASYISEQDIRDECMDRFPSDHDLHTDLLFTREDIESAARAVAREYNSMQPQVEYVDATRLPGDTGLFLNGVVAVLYRRLRNSKALNEMVYSAGGVTVDTDTTLKNNLDKLSAEYHEKFTSEAKVRKIAKNLRSAYGRIG